MFDALSSHQGQDVISVTTLDGNIASDFTSYSLISIDMDHIRAIEKWLYTLLRCLSTFMGGSKYPTLPLTSHVFKFVINMLIIQSQILVH